MSETLDKMYLEISQTTKAMTAKDLTAKTKADSIMTIIKHGNTESQLKMDMIYKLARQIYEKSSGETHYWHID